MDCKRALAESGGDAEAAVDVLRKKGLAAAAKKSSRIASEGTVAACVTGKSATLVEVNCETDFVARTDDFQDLARHRITSYNVCYTKLLRLLASGFGVRVSPFTDTKVFHHGLDIDAPKESPIRAAGAGKVVRCGFESRYGNLVVIDHGNGYRTIYAHLSERMVELGDTVRRGDLIGKVGDTGRTTGPHLHYEVQVNGLPVNPVRFLNFV